MAGVNRTRVTGWLALAAGLLAAVHGLLLALLPAGFGATTAERLLPAAVATAAGTAWLVLSATARSRAAHPAPRPSRSLPVLLCLAVALGSVAALAQALGPDGAEGRALRSIRQAGAVEREVTVLAVVSPSVRAGQVNRRVIFRTTLTLSVPFDDGPRPVTVEAETTGLPRPGDRIPVEYAPNTPALGAAPHSPLALGEIGLLIIGFAMVAALFVAAALMSGQRTRIHTWRRYDPTIHLPTAALLLTGTALADYVALALPPPLLGWPLAVLAAATPWAALLLGLRIRPSAKP